MTRFPLPVQALGAAVLGVAMVGILVIGCGSGGGGAPAEEEGPPPAFWAAYQVGLDLVKAGRYGEAIAQIEEALEISPDHIGANYQLAGLYQILGDNQRSLECITKAVELSPEPRVLYLDRYVKALVSVGRVEEAALHTGKILELDPKMPNAYRDFCTIHLKLFRLDEVIETATLAIERDVDPKYPFFRSQMHHLRGQAYQKQDRFEEAEKDYRAALEACPQYPKPYHDLGRLLVRRGEKEEGERLLEKHAKLNEIQEQIEKVYTHLGQSESALPVHLQQLISYHTLLGQFREAERAAENLLSQTPHDADALVRLGVVKIFLQEYPQALNHFRRAIKANPGFVGAYEETALLLATARNPEYRDIDEAWKMVEQARPHGGVGAHVLAELYHASGETEKAITTLRRGLARGEGDRAMVKRRIHDLEESLRAQEPEGAPGGAGAPDDPDAADGPSEQLEADDPNASETPAPANEEEETR